VCGQGILRCKCGIDNQKYATVGDVGFSLGMADVVCVVRAY